MAGTARGARGVESGPNRQRKNLPLFLEGMVLTTLITLGTFSVRPALAEGDTFTVVMTKVVCDEEADLPNIGIDGPDMTSATAANWVANHATCRFDKDWHFQWAYDPTPDPGSNSGAADGDWQSFGPSNTSGVATVVVPTPPADVTKVWFREVWDDTYVPFTHDRGEGAVDDVSAELYCHDDVWNYDNYDFVRTPAAGETYYCVAWNVAQEKPAVEPTLRISKTNNSFPDSEQPGDEVKYTLTITAPEDNESAVSDVEVTDLPPEGFTFQEGSDEADSNNANHDGPLSLAHEYASPGVWHIGTLEPGETVTLSYVTRINGSQDAGLYKDLAWAKGKSPASNVVLANASDPFVGTEVKVDVPTVAPTVTVPTLTDTVTRTRHEHVTKRVLGAATTLPLTGANTAFTAGALLLLILGMTLILVAPRLEKLHLSEAMKTILRITIYLMGAGIMLYSAHLAYAADTSVRMETPESPVNSPHFKIGFVVLDILDRSIHVQCLANGSVFQALSLESGGTSGDCGVDASVMPSDGAYEFQVRATADGETVASEKASVELISGAPGTPTNYARTSPASCQNQITFTTASDGGKTVKVEIYRSTSTNFTADSSTKVGEVAIGSNAPGNFTDTVPDCDAKYFYAIRAVSVGGIGSGFVGDTNVKVKTKRKTDRDTDTEIIPGPAISGNDTGALPVTTTETAGAVAGTTTTEEEAAPVISEDGNVLGEMTEEQEPSVIGTYAKEHPWRTLFGILMVIGAGYYGYHNYLRKKNSGV